MKRIIAILFLFTVAACTKPDDGGSSSGQNNRSREKNILSFKLLNQQANIDNSTNKIELTLPEGTDLNNIVPEIIISAKATISPQSGVAQNFSNPIDFTVTAEDGSTKKYTVLVSAAKSSQKEILSFTVNGKNGTINQTAKTIQLQLPSGSSLLSLTPTIVISSKATIAPQSGTATNFSSSVIYTVTAEDGSKVQYTATITIQASSDKKILSFDLINSNLSNSVYTSTPDTVIGIINENTKQIRFISRENANIQSVKPLIKVSNFATVTPGSMVAQDYNIPLVYTVTAQDGTTTQYTVSFEKRQFSSSLSSFQSLNPYIRPDKTSVLVGEEIMVEITGASYYALTTRAIQWSRPISGGGNTVSGAIIDRVSADGTKFYFRFSTAGNYNVWMLLEDYIGGANRQKLSNQYAISVH